MCHCWQQKGSQLIKYHSVADVYISRHFIISLYNFNLRSMLEQVRKNLKFPSTYSMFQIHKQTNISRIRPNRILRLLA